MRERAAVAEQRDGVDVVLDVLHADQQRVVHEAARAEPIRVVEQLRHNLPRASCPHHPRRDGRSRRASNARRRNKERSESPRGVVVGREAMLDGLHFFKSLKTPHFIPQLT